MTAEDIQAMADAQEWLIAHPHASFLLEGRPGEWFATFANAPPSEAKPTIAEAIRAALKEMSQ